jgi:hypothetical protein
MRDNNDIGDKGIERDKPEGGSIHNGLGDGFKTETDNIDQGIGDLGFADL